MTPQADQQGRRSFGPVVLVGLVAATLAAVSGARPWVVERDAAPAGDPVPGIDLVDPVVSAGEMPVALALGLVVLAAWGVVLVTRGRVRRGVAALALLAATGLAASVLVAAVTLPDRVAQAVREQGGEVAVTGFSPWFWTAVVAAVGSVVATSAAVRLAPRWPEMGRRYDAPGAASASGPAPAERSPLDLWKSMDEGHDPTA